MSLIIGIDPGVNTGIGIYCLEHQQIIYCASADIITAFEIVLQHKHECRLIRIEDARLRKYFGNSGREKLQGAGSVKRDCSIWESFCKRHEIRFELVPPRNNKTKLDAKTFNNFTGYTGQTNEHARDAAMLVYKLKLL